MAPISVSATTTTTTTTRAATLVGVGVGVRIGSISVALIVSITITITAVVLIMIIDPIHGFAWIGVLVYIILIINLRIITPLALRTVITIIDTAIAVPVAGIITLIGVSTAFHRIPVVIIISFIQIMVIVIAIAGE